MIRKLRRLVLPPDCREVAQVLQSFLDGELPESKTHLVAVHLEHCERCGIEASVYREVKRSLAELSTAPDPDAVERLRTFAEGLTADEAT
ncbi:MAG: zf-HC2 domain-containing protein [Actinobacteria bacterium]|nr:zf-HC2 domain-containing protein [Actinomycetota bacterium]